MDRGHGSQEGKPSFLKTLHKGQPKVLGAVQISLVLIYIALGVISYDMDYTFTCTIYYGASFWGIPFYIITGSLSVTVERKLNPTISLVRAFLAMNIICSIQCLGVLSVLCYDMYWTVFNGYTTLPIVLSFLIIANVLQFCVAVTLSTFGSRALSTRTSQQQTFQVPMIPTQYSNPMMTSVSTSVVGNINPYFQQEDNENPQDYQLPQVSTAQLGLQKAPAFSHQNYQLNRQIGNYGPTENKDRMLSRYPVSKNQPEYDGNPMNRYPVSSSPYN